MRVNKITPGFVVQTYDTDQQKWLGQEFVAGDQSEYEEAGTGTRVDPARIWPEKAENYLPFLMEQPN